MNDAPFDSLNAAYVQALYEEYARNPDSVPVEWRDFFGRGTRAVRDAGLLVPEGLAADGVVEAPHPSPPPLAATTAPTASSAREVSRLRALLPVVARATSLVQAFRDHGHMLAGIDPLGSEPPGHPQLDPSFFGTSMEELEELPASVIMDQGAEGETVANALRRLRAAYCGRIGYEFEHLEDPARVRWLWDQVESAIHTAPLTREEKLAILGRLS